MENVSRRSFMQSLVLLSGITVSSGGMLLLEGCPVSQSQLAQLVAEVGTGLSQILPFIKSVSASVAAQIQATFSTLETAVQAWKPGTVVADVEQAINAFVAAMGSIPYIGVILGPYQPLALLIVAVAEGLVNLLIPNPAPTTSSVKATFSAASAMYPKPPHTDREFKSKFNSVAKANNLPVSID